MPTTYTPISLDDQEMATVLDAAALIGVSHRSDFLVALADALQGANLGPGSVYRAVREVQSRFLAVPTIGKR
jgi:hypothetical protein